MGIMDVAKGNLFLAHNRNSHVSIPVLFRERGGEHVCVGVWLFLVP